MRLSRLFAVAAVAGMAMFGAQSPASAAQAGAAYAPAATNLAVSNDVIQVARRCWWRNGRKVCRRYGSRRNSGISLHFGTSRRGYRRGNRNYRRGHNRRNRRW